MRVGTYSALAMPTRSGVGLATDDGYDGYAAVVLVTLSVVVEPFPLRWNRPEIPPSAGKLANHLRGVIRQPQACEARLR